MKNNITTPNHPDYLIDWDDLINQNKWLQDMEGVQQEYDFHAEGDVLTHTKMVVEAIVNDEDCRKLPFFERSIMFTSALTHDIAKPHTTKFIDERWTSPNHARVGEHVFRSLCINKALDINFSPREYICKLIRYHGLPLRFIDKPDPERSLREASLLVNLNDLYMLAKADVNGRITTSKDDLLARLQLFKELAIELECWDKPSKFESDHHRFMWSVGRKDYSYQPYDNTKFNFTLLCGLPGCGKSTWIANNHNGRQVISLDKLRNELDIDPADSGKQADVARIAKDQAKELFRKGQSVIWDSTSLIKDIRSEILAIAATYGAKTEIVYIEADKKDMLKRNASREEPVPESVINKMIMKLEMPTLLECHSLQYIV